MHWFKDQEKFLKDTYKLLAHEGEALFVSACKGPYFQIYNKLAKTEKWGKYMTDIKEIQTPTYHSWPNVIETYTNMARKAGFEVVSCELLHRKHEYLPYVTWRSVNPFLSRIKA